MDLHKSLTVCATIIGCTLVGVSHARASIPLPIAVKVVSADLRTEAISKATVELLSAYDNFQWAQSSISRGDLINCLESPNAVACVRDLARRSAAPAPAVVLAKAANGNLVEWTCVGAGSSSALQPEQQISVDMKAAMFGTASERTVLQRKLVRCIWLAATEAHSGISAD